MRIALIGAEPKSARELRELLEAQNYEVTTLLDPATAVSSVRRDRAQLAVLHGVAGKEAALGFIRELRRDAAMRLLPVLHVHPAAATAEMVEFLDAGVDDFLGKPFNAQIFLARVRTLLRRQLWSGLLQEDSVVRLDSAGLSLHLVERSAYLKSETLVLTRLEFDLLAYLLKNKEKAVKRSEILEVVWKYPENVETRTLDKHVESLRKKLGSIGKNIRTVHGIGYRFQEPGALAPRS